MDRLAIEMHLPRHWRLHRAQRADQRRFAGAVRTEQADETPARDRKIERPEQRPAAVAGEQGRGRQHRHSVAPKLANTVRGAPG